MKNKTTQILGRIYMYKTFIFVFKDKISLLTSSLAFVALFVSLLYARQLLFFEPYLIFYLPQDHVLSFASIVTVSMLTGIVTAMVVFKMRFVKGNNKKISSSLFGSLIGAGSGVCASCSAIGISILSILGVVGASLVSFLEYYEIPIRVTAIAILSGTYFMISKNIASSCKIGVNKIQN